MTAGDIKRFVLIDDLEYSLNTANMQ